MRFGPYPFDAAFIDHLVSPGNKGHYVLGNQDTNDRFTFHRKYVGRSDTCLKAELKQYLGRGYDAFWFEFDSSAILAFLSECILYHDLLRQGINLDNQRHPDVPDPKNIPAGINPKCWICGHPQQAPVVPPAGSSGS